MSTLNDIFGGQHQLLEEVIILPFRGGTGTGGAYPNDTYSLPAGYSWTDFESVEFSLGDTGGSVDVYSTALLSKDIAAVEPTSWTVVPSYNIGADVRTVAIQALDNHRFSINGASPNVGITLVKGYTRRYATQNVSAIVNVPGGEPNGDIGVDERIVLDIETVLGSDYVGKDLIVQAEIYNDGTIGGAVGWGRVADSNWVQGTTGVNTFTGVGAATFEGKIVVQTGFTELARDGSQVFNPFGMLSGVITSAPCRVKVWKIDQFITNTAGSGGGGKTTLFESTGETTGTHSLTDDISKYDMIQFEGRVDSPSFTVSTLVDPDTILSSNGNIVIGTYSSGGVGFMSRITGMTNATFTVSVLGTATVNKIVGINYSS